MSPTNETVENLCTLYGYDTAGNQVTTTNALDQTSLTVYDGANRPIVRIAKCAVPEIVQLLWDSDPFVRSAAAGALEAITEIGLVIEAHKLKPSHPGSVFADEPEGDITGTARAWWMEEGQYLDWSGESDLCSPSSP